MADKFRWWRVSKVNGTVQVHGAAASEDLCKVHQEVKRSGAVGEVYYGHGPDHPGSSFEGPFTVEWDTVDGVSEIPDSLAKRLLQPGMRALND